MAQSGEAAVDELVGFISGMFTNDFPLLKGAALLVNRTKRGAQLANETARSLHEIVNGIIKVSDLVGKGHVIITDAAHVFVQVFDKKTGSGYLNPET